MTFPAEQLYLIIDYEIFSAANLKQVGAYEYANHASTEILCFAWRAGTKTQLANTPTQVWSRLLHKVDHPAYMGFIRCLLDPRYVIVAHNANFERVITEYTLAHKELKGHRCLQELISNVDRWLCTAALSAALALPRKLEDVANVLNLRTKKDMEGHRTMLKWSKPRAPSKNDPSTRWSDPEELQKVLRYCGNDVDVETELFLKLPPLSAEERKVWCLDQTINLRGFAVDRPLVKKVIAMIHQETKALNYETIKLTGHQVNSTTQVAQALSWLEEQNCFLPNLQAKTVADALQDGLAEGDAKRLLEIRQAVAKTSTKKFKAMEMRSRHDGRIRDNLIYHGASTGRWSGAGVQPQNFAKGKIKEQRELIEVLKTGDLMLVQDTFGDPMEAFSSALRGMIRAPKGNVLDIADYNAIELRVLFWVAKHEEGLKALREGRDLYKELARDVYKVPVIKIDPDQRFLGKTGVLGCGYGCGKIKFGSMCRMQGRDISDELAELVVNTYRKTHKPVVILWSTIEKAARFAIENPGKKYSVNRTSWWVANDFLWCELPSGRKLAYYQPSVKYEVDKWKNKRPVIYHYGVNPRTKKWTEDKTWGGTLVENVVQAISRDIMAAGMLRIEETGIWEIVLSVHDELVAERPDDEFLANNRDFCDLMAELPEWAEGLPLKVEGFAAKRYRK